MGSRLTFFLQKKFTEFICLTRLKSICDDKNTLSHNVKGSVFLQRARVMVAILALITDLRNVYNVSIGLMEIIPTGLKLPQKLVDRELL